MTESIGKKVLLPAGLPFPTTPSVNPQTIVDGDQAGKFTDLLVDALQSVNHVQKDAATIQKDLMAGESVELHQVMIKAEEAGLSMDLLLEIRNRLINGYNELIRMPM